MPDQKPSEGRIVHIFSRYQEGVEPIGIGPYAAIVTYVWDDTSISAEAFPTHKITLPFGEPIPFNDGNLDKDVQVWWQWPERV